MNWSVETVSLKAMSRRRGTTGGWPGWEGYITSHYTPWGYSDISPLNIRVIWVWLKKLKTFRRVRLCQNNKQCSLSCDDMQHVKQQYYHMHCHWGGSGETLYCSEQQHLKTEYYNVLDTGIQRLDGNRSESNSNVIWRPCCWTNWRVDAMKY